MRAESGSTAGKAVAVCFFIMWVIITFGMGFTFLQWGAPGIIGIVPFMMGIFGIVMCIAILKAKSTAKRLPRLGSGYSISTGDSMYVERPSVSERKVIYQVPERCPSCGAPLSDEEVDWVGPLQARCPYCFATVNVTPRDL